MVEERQEDQRKYELILADNNSNRNKMNKKNW